MPILSHVSFCLTRHCSLAFRPARPSPRIPPRPVEYYNNLPYHSATTTSQQATPSDIAILLDPIIATGATASAAIDTLKDWGVKRIVVCSVLASHEGLKKVSRVWSEGVQIWVGAVDPGTDAKGMIKPGLGDVGDRLFLTIGK